MLPTRNYYEFDDDARAHPASLTEFLLRCVLGARGEAGFPSNDRGFDEDVNVYLAGLLGRFLSSEYHEDAKRFTFPTDVDLFREVARTGDDRFCYRAYRTNADHLLLQIGLFQRVDRPRPHQPHLERSPREFIGRGETYYGLASSSLRRLRRRRTGTEEAMEKLALNFAAYAEVLARLRTSYFHLTSRLGEGRLFHLLNDPVEPTAKEAYDRFLDAYSEWKKEPATERRRVLLEAIEAVRSVDPDFAFELDDENAA